MAAAEPASGEHWQDVSTVAERDGDGWAAARVEDRRDERAVGDPSAGDGHAPTNGISLFLVDLERDGQGIEMHSYRTVDDRRAADIVFDGLRLAG